MQQKLEALQAQYKELRRLLFISPVLLAVAVACIFINKWLTFLVLGVALAFQLLVFRRKQNAYLDGFVRENLRATVGQQIGSEDIHEKDGGLLTEQDVQAARLLPCLSGGALLRMGMSGSVKGMPVALCDATLREVFKLVKNGKYRQHFTSGIWMRFTLPADTGCDWQILDKDLLPTPVRTSFFADPNMLSELGDAAMDARFKAYHAVGNGQPLPAGLLAQLRLLADYTPGKVGISLRGSTLTVFIRDRLLARSPRLEDAPSEEMLVFDPMPELAYVVRMASVVSGQASASVPEVKAAPSEEPVPDKHDSAERISSTDGNE